MFLDKLKVISVMVLGLFLGGFGVGLFGMPGPALSQAAPPGEPGHFVQAAAEREEQEPLDGKLLLDAKVQKELRLSKNQVARLQEISRDVDKKSGDKKQAIQGIQKENAARQKEIEQLQRQIAELQQKIGKIQNGIEKDRTASLGKAAPEILSAQAVKRLREIQRQQHGLDHVLQTPQVQRMLKLDDEQLKKIETILKERPVSSTRLELQWNVAATYLNLKSPGNITNRNTMPTLQAQRWVGDFYGVHPNALYGLQPYALLSTYDNGGYEMTLRKLFDVLSENQKQVLLDWVGEPYQSSSWQKLREKHK